jgi:hypothetical protein
MRRDVQFDSNPARQYIGLSCLALESVREANNNMKYFNIPSTLPPLIFITNKEHQQPCGMDLMKLFNKEIAAPAQLSEGVREVLLDFLSKATATVCCFV